MSAGQFNIALSPPVVGHGPARDRADVRRLVGLLRRCARKACKIVDGTGRTLRRTTMLSQITAITGLNLKSIPERWAPSLVIVVGLAGVVAVFTALLAMATGFESTLRPPAAPTTRSSCAAVRTRNSTPASAAIRHADQAGPGIRKGADGMPLARPR
jgi:hypothetical protein